MTHEPAFIADQFHTEHDIFKQASLIETLRREKEMRVHEIASLLKLQSSYVSHYLRLLKLPHIVVDGYYGKFVSKSHLFIIARLPDQKAMIEVYEETLAKGLTAFQTEEMVRQRLYGIKSEGSYIPLSEIQAFEQNIKKKNNKIKTKIIQSRTRGKLILEVEGSLFFSTEILRSMIERLIRE